MQDVTSRNRGVIAHRRVSRVKLCALVAAISFPIAVWSAQDFDSPNEDAYPTLAISQRESSDVTSIQRATSPEADASSSQERNPVRTRILKLLSLSHARDEYTSRAALEELESLGLTGAQLELGRQLVHPDAAVRRELAESLSLVDAQTQRELASELARDPDEKVRVAAGDILLQPPALNLPAPTAPPILNEDNRRPPVLRRPGESLFTEEPADVLEEIAPLVMIPVDVPPGYSGWSGIAPLEEQESQHFVPVEDRWRLGFPEWDRYGNDHPPVDDYPYIEGHWWDPYNQNVLKGDYPIIGQHTFLNLSASITSLFEPRSLPVATTPFESTIDPFSVENFGNPRQFLTSNFFRLSMDLIHGNAGFKPVDWQVHVTPVFNINYLRAQELSVVNPDVRAGTDRLRDFMALEEWFVESKIADLSPDYDFVSARFGSQPFTSDFRGFIFSDVNRGVRLFGTRNANRDQFNVIAFDQTEKDTNSQLNTFHDRHQNTLIANYYRQDFLVPGYTGQMSFHYNRDEPSFKFDKNDFLVRPDPVGVFRPHLVESYYLGFAGDGHIGRFNISNAFYWALGQDSLNPLAGQDQIINAQMAAVELSYDRDWVRFRTSFFWSSGDDDISDGVAKGFDTIFDNPNFAGGQFSFWQRQAIPLFGVNLVNRFSLVPDLRSSKFQGQSNFVNPGLLLLNGGMDFDVTPKVKLISNVNFLWFDKTNVLEHFLFQSGVSREIGTDASLGLEYRPFLNNNVVIVAGLSGLFPAAGLKDIYSNLGGELGTLYSHFVEMTFLY